MYVESHARACKPLEDSVGMQIFAWMCPMCTTQLALQCNGLSISLTMACARAHVCISAPLHLAVAFDEQEVQMGSLISALNEYSNLVKAIPVRTLAAFSFAQTLASNDKWWRWKRRAAVWLNPRLTPSTACVCFELCADGGARPQVEGGCCRGGDGSHGCQQRCALGVSSLPRGRRNMNMCHCCAVGIASMLAKSGWK